MKERSFSHGTKKEDFKLEIWDLALKETHDKLAWDSFLWKALEKINIRWQENKKMQSSDIISRLKKEMNLKIIILLYA